jgi:hypothetical protein
MRTVPQPKNGSHEGIFQGEKEEFPPAEMLGYLRLVQRYALVQPRTYWSEFPFFIRVSGFRQKLCLGQRPEDLADTDTVEQKAWEKHQSYLHRLERFPLEKAEYYMRLKAAHGVQTVRALATLTGENWSYIAKVLRTLELPEPVKGFLQQNRTEPTVVRFFHLRRLLDIVRQGEERLQLARFRELVEEWGREKFCCEDAHEFRSISEPEHGGQQGVDASPDSSLTVAPSR